MDNQKIIKKTINFVQKTLKNVESGHNWWHVYRVWNLSKKLYNAEKKGDLFVIELSALLHDIADAKFHDGNEKIGPDIARNFLENENINSNTIDRVCEIIEKISFKNRKEVGLKNIELQIVQDADRLDALGAIGIGRTFNFGGFKGNEMYDPNIEPNLNQSKHEYCKSKGPTLNHFYEKLFLLKDLLNTDSAKKIAVDRHDFMKEFVDRFKSEWDEC